MDAFGFGPAAEKLCSWFPFPRAAIVIEPAFAATAVQKAVELRAAGVEFDCLPLLQPAQALAARSVAAEVLHTSADYDYRRNVLEIYKRTGVTINGKPSAEFGRIPARQIAALRDVAALADGWIVRSWAEHRRCAALLGMQPRRVTRMLGRNPNVPRVDKHVSDGRIVVWAPDLGAHDVALYVLALQDLRREIDVVCNGGALHGLRARLVSVSDSAQSLRHAAAVLDTETLDPTTALAIAELGIKVAAASTTGVREYAPSTRVYDPWDRLQIYVATVTTLGKRAALPAPPEKPPQLQTHAIRERSPKVSLIVRTANRPRLLKRALESIRKQQYENIEAIVVNNGGADVAHVCAEFSNVRYEPISAGGIWHAANHGFALIDAEYAGLLDDDDALFPDHVMRLVDALERSAATAAYADAMNVYIRPLRDNFAVTGYSAILVPSVEPSLMLSRCLLVGSLRVLFRTEALREGGGFFEDLPVAGDYEAWLRLSELDDFVRVNRVTGLYTQFADKANVSLRDGGKYLDAHRRIFERYPTARQPVIAERNRILEAIARIGGLGMSGPSVNFDRQPLLFAD